MPGVMFWSALADVLGVFAAVAAIVLGVVGVRIARAQASLAYRQNALESEQTKLARQLVTIEEGRDRKAEREESRANLQPSIFRGDSMWRLRVVNFGPAVGRDVRVELGRSTLS